MAKFKSIFIIALVLLLTACGAKTVTVEFPASFFEGEDIESFAEQFRSGTGFKKVKVNDDGSMTLIVTEEKYNLQVEAMEETAKSLYATIGEEGGFFKTVKKLDYSEDYTSLTFTVDREAYEASNEAENIEQVIYVSRLYQVFALNTEGIIEVNYVDENTGEIYKTDLYNAAGKIDETGEASS